MLRLYRDTLASDIKTSVKMTVLNMPLESDSISGEGIGDTDGGFSSLNVYLISAERTLAFDLTICTHNIFFANCR